MLIFEYNNSMITDKITESILYSLQLIYHIHPKSDEVEVSQTANREHGDYSSNIAFKLAKELHKKPYEIANELAVSLERTGDYKKVEAINGFINFFLDHEYFQNILSQILEENDHYADLALMTGKKIQVEFISANPTGPLTLANGRGGFGGDVLARVFEKVGAKVQREYYVNDGGNQIKILNKSIVAKIEDKWGIKSPDNDSELYLGDYIDKLADDFIASHDFTDDISKIESLIENEDYAKIILDWIKNSVKNMGINFDNWFSEKTMIERGEVEQAIEKMKSLGLTKEDSGALWLKTTDFGDDKDRVLIKTDGTKTYFANDVAYHWDKFSKRHFDKVVNFWGADHHGYIGRMQAAVTAMGFNGKLQVAIMQMVHLIKNGEEFKMSKRKGTYVTMDDLFSLIGGSVQDSVDVARFFFLMRSFNTHMDFDLDLAKEKTDKNPVFYVKYAHARLSSILRNAKSLKLPKSDLSLLTEVQETELIEQMAQLPQVLTSIVTFDEYPVHYLTFYAIDLAKKFHVFYDKCRVIDEDNLPLTTARIELIKATQIVLGIVMRDLIGIDTPEKM